MEPTVDLSPGATDNPLAARLAERIRDNLRRSPKKAAELGAIRGSVLIVAQDTGWSLTLRFDHGRLIIHDGAIGIPSVTFCGDEGMLLRLRDVPLTRIGRLPLPGLSDAKGRETLSLLAGALMRRELTIYGLWSRPRLVLVLLRLISAYS